MCAVSSRKCEGVCPESRAKRNQKNDCPAFYIKAVEIVRERPKYNDQEFMEGENG